MSDFQWLLGQYLDKAASNIQGIVEKEWGSPFSTIVMDAAFKLNEKSLSEMRDFIANVLGVKEPLSNVCVMSILYTNLDRKQTTASEQTKLYLVRKKDEKLAAILFMGSMLDE